MSKPILLLQWLKPGEYRETRAALTEFAKSVNIEHADVEKKGAAKKAFDTWLADNPSNAQYPFIGGHGVVDEDDAIGIGASGKADEHATWPEIWQWMAGGKVTGGLLLGGCRSADAAAAMSRHLRAGATPAVPYIVGFSEEIDAKEIEDVLRQLLKNTDVKKIVYLDQELDTLRNAVPGSAVKMYYPAKTKQGKLEYVDVDQFEQKVGKTFKYYLEDNDRI